MLVKFEEITNIDIALNECAKVKRNLWLSILKIKLLQKNNINVKQSLTNDSSAAALIINDENKFSKSTTIIEEPIRQRKIQEMLKSRAIINFHIIKIRRSVQSILINVETIFKQYCVKEIMLRQKRKFSSFHKHDINHDSDICLCNCQRKKILNESTMGII